MTENKKTLSFYLKCVTQEQFDLLIPRNDLYEAHVRERMYKFFVEGQSVAEIIKGSTEHKISRGVLTRQLESVMDKLPDELGKVVLKLWVKCADAATIQKEYKHCLLTPPIEDTKLSSSLFRGSLSDADYTEYVMNNRSEEMAFMSLRSAENGRLYFVEGLTVNEIAPITGSPIRTIKEHLKRISTNCLGIKQALIPMTLYINFKQALSYAEKYRVVRYHVNIAL